MKRKLPPSTAVVTQSNELVSARYALPLGEMRLLLTVMAKVQPSDTTMTVYRIPVAEFADFLKVDKNSAYREVQKITKELVKRYVEIKEPGSLTQTTWVSQAKYIDGTGTVDVKLSDAMIPHLLRLKDGNFTQCKLLMLLSFKSQYTMRLYMLLKQKLGHNPYVKSYEFDLGELRKQLGVSVEAIPRRDKFDKPQEAIELYPIYRDFKRWVLEVAKKELNAKADLSFEYEEIRHGRGVTALSFRVFAIPRAELLPAPAEGQQSPLPGMDLDMVATLLAFVPEAHRTKKGVRATIVAAEKQHGFDYVKRNILYSNAHASKNYAGYLAGALAIDYGHDWEIEQQQASKAAEQAQKTVALQELNALADEIRALQRNSKLTNSPELWQQAERLKAEYARKREIYDAENTEEEENEP